MFLAHREHLKRKGSSAEEDDDGPEIYPICTLLMYLSLALGMLGIVVLVTILEEVDPDLTQLTGVKSMGKRGQHAYTYASAYFGGLEVKDIKEITRFTMSHDNEEEEGPKDPDEPDEEATEGPDEYPKDEYTPEEYGDHPTEYGSEGEDPETGEGEHEYDTEEPPSAGEGGDGEGDEEATPDYDETTIISELETTKEQSTKIRQLTLSLRSLTLGSKFPAKLTGKARIHLSLAIYKQRGRSGRMDERIMKGKIRLGTVSKGLRGRTFIKKKSSNPQENGLIFEHDEQLTHNFNPTQPIKYILIKFDMGITSPPQITEPFRCRFNLFPDELRKTNPSTWEDKEQECRVVLNAQILMDGGGEDDGGNVRRIGKRRKRRPKRKSTPLRGVRRRGTKRGRKPKHL